MAYNPYVWKDDLAGGTPITAARLNIIETAIAAAATAADTAGAAATSNASAISALQALIQQSGLDALVAALLLTDRSLTRNAALSIVAGAGATTGTATGTAQLVSSSQPVVSGQSTVGSVLTAGNGGWSSTPDTFAYQWQRNTSPIPSATGATYTLVSADAGASLRVVVTAIKAGFTSGTAISQAFQVAAASGPTSAWTGTDGSAWPSDWTVARTAAGTIVSNRGRLTTSAAAFASDANAFRSGMTAVADTEVYVEFLTDATVQQQFMIVGLRAQGVTAAGSSSYPNNGYFLELEESTGVVTLRKAVGSGTATTIGTVQIAPNSLPVSSTIAVRLNVSGARIRWRVWNVTSAEPTAWSQDYTDTDNPYLTAGKLFLSVQSGTDNAARSIDFQNLQIAGVTNTGGASTTPTVQATATPGANIGTLSWTVSNGPISGLTGWLVSRDGNDTNGAGPWSTTIGADQTSFVFTSLQSGATYTLGVAPVVASVPGVVSSATVVPSGTVGGGAVVVPPQSLSGKFAAAAQILPVPARGWYSGATGEQTDGMNTSWDTWRGVKLDSQSHWIDQVNGGVWTGGIGASPPGSGVANTKRWLDISIGGPSDYNAAANGSLDAALTSMFQRVRANRTINGVLYPTIFRPAHEMNGNWYGHSVNKTSQLAAYKATMKRWRKIMDKVFPEAFWAIGFNADNFASEINPADYIEAGVWDVMGVDRYNQYPHIGTNNSGQYIDFNNGSNQGSVTVPLGIEKWRQMSAQVGLPMYLPEYANNGSTTEAQGGEGGYWMTQFLNWVKAHKGFGPGQVFMETFFNVGYIDAQRWWIYGDKFPITSKNTSTRDSYRNFFLANG